MAVARYSKYIAAVPATEGAVRQSGSINLSAKPSKKSSEASGIQIRALARAESAWGEPAGAKYTQPYADMQNTKKCTYHSQQVHTDSDTCVTNVQIQLRLVELQHNKINKHTAAE